MATEAEARPVSAVTLRDRLASGALKSIDLVEACLKRIETREDAVGAWAWIDPDFARAQARNCDTIRSSGRPLGALHGLPVGLKDIIDTARIPTENGSALDKGRVPTRDAYVTERLKAAGAVILGKTVTTELAFMAPNKTRNPHDPAHTPGGSSQGSAAAVADGMVPLSVGTQTGGSVIRPAAFCGVTGFKPSYGLIPRRGVLAQSPTLDTIGVFAADPLGAAMLVDALAGSDPEDTATRPAPPPHVLDIAESAPPLPPIFAFMRPPGWDTADPEMHAAFDELIGALGDQAFEIPLPALFQEAAEVRARIHLAEMARCYHRYWRDSRDALAPETLAGLEEGNTILARDYVAALDWRGVLNAVLSEIFERCDAILCPAAPGPAPRGLETTGSAIFNGLWTLCGTPAVTLPLLTSEAGLPMGVQLVGPVGGDARLMRSANWLDRWAGGEIAPGATTPRKDTP